MYNTPHIRNGGFGALQVEAVTNRPLSIARRHLAASQLRMRDIEPDELSSSEWVRFLVMPELERERWMTDFRRRRRNSAESSSSAEAETSNDKAEEARQDLVAAAEEPRRAVPAAAAASRSAAAPTGSTPAVSIWARYFADDDEERDVRPPPPNRDATPPMHLRRAVTGGVVMEAPPTYESVVRPRTPPPAYEPRGDDGIRSPGLP